MRFLCYDIPVSIDENFLIECRRSAYIECSMRFMEDDSVVGYFGQVPLSIMYGYNLLPVPMEDVDIAVLQYVPQLKVEKTCDVIKSTLAYVTSDKCPILYSCKSFVFSDFCTVFFTQFSAHTKKPCLQLDTKADTETLKTFLADVYHRDYDEALATAAEKKLSMIDGIIEKIRLYTDISGREIFLLTYYASYITDIDKRLAFFKKTEEQCIFHFDKKTERPAVTACCPRGYYTDVYSHVPAAAELSWAVPCSADFSDALCPVPHSTDVQYSE